MIVKAPAKLNLALDVLGVREDGYHEIDLVSIPIEIHDSIVIQELTKGYETYITSDDVTLICDETNTVNRAFTMLKEKFNLDKPFRIEIFKRIPTQAGLAGGSADAASLIKAILKEKKIDVSQEQLIEMGLSIGADVPYCLLNLPARVRGIGEIVEPLGTKFSFGVLIVKPKQGLSTKEVYDNVDLSEVTHQDIEGLIRVLKSNPSEEEIAPYMINALTPSAIKLCPKIKTILESLKDMGFSASMMSGSGSACFALSKDMKKLEKGRKTFAKMGYEAILTTTLNQSKKIF